MPLQNKAPKRLELNSEGELSDTAKVIFLTLSLPREIHSNTGLWLTQLKAIVVEGLRSIFTPIQEGPSET